MRCLLEEPDPVLLGWGPFRSQLLLGLGLGLIKLGLVLAVGYGHSSCV